jgi:hypothetical protein
MSESLRVGCRGEFWESKSLRGGLRREFWNSESLRLGLRGELEGSKRWWGRGRGERGIWRRQLRR